MTKPPSDSQIPENYRREGEDFLANLHLKMGISPDDNEASTADHLGGTKSSGSDGNAPNLRENFAKNKLDVAQIQTAQEPLFSGGNSQKNPEHSSLPANFPNNSAPESGENLSLSHENTETRNQDSIALDATKQAENATENSVNASETEKNMPDSLKNLTPNEEYLNKISKEEPKKKPFLTKKIIILFGGLIVAALIVFVVGMVLNSAKEAPFKTALDVGSKLNNLQALIDYGEDQNKHISRANTIKVLREAAVVVPSRQHELSKSFTLVADTKSGSNKKPKGDFVEKLDEQLAIGNFNAAFTEEFRENINEVRLAIIKLKNETKSKKGRLACEKTERDLVEILSRLNSEE